MYKLTAFAAVFALVGCQADDGKKTDTAHGTTPGDPCLPGENPTLQLGHGELEYLELDTTGSTNVELIHGPQGGYHVNMALSATYLNADTTWAVGLTGTVDGVQMGDTRPLATMRCNPGQGALHAWSLLLIWDATPEELHGKSADIEATIVDSAGTELSTTATIEIWDPSLE